MSDTFSQVEREYDSSEQFVSVGSASLYVNAALWETHMTGVEAVSYLVDQDAGWLALVPADPDADDTWPRLQPGGTQSGGQFSCGQVLGQLGATIESRVRVPFNYDESAERLILDLSDYQ